MSDLRAFDGIVTALLLAALFWLGLYLLIRWIA